MARTTVSQARAPKALVAWLALAVIVTFILVKWPESKPVPIEAVSQESIETTTTTTTTPEPVMESDKVEVVADTLNFRSRPEYEDRTILKTLTRGDIMVVKERTKGWLLVELDNGQSGYVANKPDFIRKVK